MRKPRKEFSRRDFLRVLKQALLSFVALGSGSAVYAFAVEPRWLDVENIDLAIPDLPDAFSGFRLVQASDIHMGGWMNRSRLRDVLAVVRKQRPDLVTMTGDFVFGHGWSQSLDIAAEDFISEAKLLTADLPTLGVLGNHDHWTDAEKVRAMLAESGIVELRNDVYPVRREEDRLYIAGVDDIWENKARLDEVVAKLPLGGPAILLAHEPDFADESAKE